MPEILDFLPVGRARHLTCIGWTRLQRRGPPVELQLVWTIPKEAARRSLYRAGRAVRRGSGTSRRSLSTRRRSPRSTAELTRGDQRPRNSRRRADGRFGVAGLGHAGDRAPRGHAQPRRTRAGRARGDRRHRARSRRTRRAMYWDQSVYKKPHGAEARALAPGQRYLLDPQGTHMLDRDHRRDSENGCVAVMPGVHRGNARAPSTAIGEECGATGHLGRGAGPRRQCRGVQLAHSACDETQHRRRAQAYILQYIPGAVICRGNPAKGPATRTEVIGDDERCFPIVSNGDGVDPHPCRRRRLARREASEPLRFRGAPECADRSLHARSLARLRATCARSNRARERRVRGDDADREDI